MRTQKASSSLTGRDQGPDKSKGSSKFNCSSRHAPRSCRSVYTGVHAPDHSELSRNKLEVNLVLAQRQKKEDVREEAENLRAYIDRHFPQVEIGDEPLEPCVILFRKWVANGRDEKSDWDTLTEKQSVALAVKWRTWELDRDIKKKVEEFAPYCPYLSPEQLENIACVQVFFDYGDVKSAEAWFNGLNKDEKMALAFAKSQSESLDKPSVHIKSSSTIEAQNQHAAPTTEKKSNSECTLF